MEKTKLMPEKLRGRLTWTNLGSSLVLQNRGILVAQWDPNVRRRDLPKGIVSIYGEPRGRMFEYQTWAGWKKKVWDAYRMKPPTSYSI